MVQFRADVAEWFTSFYRRTMFSVLNLFVCALSLRVVSSFSHFQLQIPNGDRVPNPCESGEVWIGVGHQKPAGAGARNPFGRDFESNDYVSAVFT